MGYYDPDKKEVVYYCIHCNLTMIKKLKEKNISSIIHTDRWK